MYYMIYPKNLVPFNKFFLKMCTEHFYNNIKYRIKITKLNATYV